MRVKAHDMLQRLDDWYEKKLRWALDHRRLVIISVVVFALISVGLIKFIGTEFFPDQDEGQFNITVKLPVGTRPEITDQYMRKVEDYPQSKCS